VPECPDFFEWNGWYYLIFSNHTVARYRMSRSPFGPWLRPVVDTFDSDISRVLKSAAFSGNRRLGVTFLPTRKDGKNDGELLYAGNAVFREIIQFDDGTLGSKFPPEMIPPGGSPGTLSFDLLTEGATQHENDVRLESLEGFSAGRVADVPRDFRLSMEVTAQPNTGSFGLLLRGSEGFEGSCELRFLPFAAHVELGSQTISGVEGLSEPFRLEVVVKDDIFDVCIGARRCLIQRAPEANGDRLFFFCRNGQVSFENIELRELLSS